LKQMKLPWQIQQLERKKKKNVSKERGKVAV
jgi:hypothetical protein